MKKLNLLLIAILVASLSLQAQTKATTTTYYGEEASSSGEHNSNFGYHTGYKGGDYNTFVGSYAGNNNYTGGYNSFFGYQSGLLLESGSQNTFLGTQSGYSATRGNNNTYLGYQAGYKNVTGKVNVFIGNQAGYNELGSAKLYIDVSDTDKPLVYGDFNSNLFRIYGELQIGNPSDDGYAFPTESTTVNRILKTNADGDLIWADATSADADWYAVDTSAPPTNIDESIYTDGNVGIGLDQPSHKLTVKNSIKISGGADGFGPTLFFNNETVPDASNGKYFIEYVSGEINGLNFGIPFPESGHRNYELFLSKNHQIGMGTNITSETIACSDCNEYRLFVKDGIKTEKIKVEIAADNGWADYVFENNYKLRNLNDLEKFIKTNKHLPEVPSTQEAIANGIELKEMNILLLKKVEELTLYLIEQEKRIKALEADKK